MCVVCGVGETCKERLCVCMQLPLCVLVCVQLCVQLCAAAGGCVQLAGLLAPCAL